MGIKLYEMEFDEAVKAELEDEIDKLEDETLYASDIPDKILEEDRANGCMFCKEDSVTFICNNWEAAGDTVEYLRDQDLDVPNPFQDAEKFVIEMFDMGLNNLLQESEFINENWNSEEFCLGRDTINLILRELGIKNELDQELGEEYER